MAILSNIKLLFLVMLGVLFAVLTVIYALDVIRFTMSWLFSHRHLTAYKIRRALTHLLIMGGLFCLWLGYAQSQKLLANVIAVNNPTTTRVKHKPKFHKEKIKPLTPKMQLKAQRANLHSIGELSIPHVHLQLPIFNSLTNVTLARGACVMQAHMKMGHSNYALAGHYLTSDGALFSPIAKIKKGNKIYVKSQHHKYTYQAYRIAKIPPTATQVLKPTKKKIITLITCADGGSNRYLVRGKLVKKSKL